MKAIKRSIEKIRPPVFDAKLFTLAFFDLHLRQNETAGTEFRMLVAHVESTGEKIPH